MEKLNIENSPAFLQESAQRIGPYPATYEGRGIVMPAGGIKYLTNAYCSIRLLRHYDCELPIEIWYLGEKEYSAKIEELLTPYNVTFIDARKVQEDHPHPNLNGWELKPYAVLHSKFKQVLLLDADVFCDGDPTFTFESPMFNQYGAVFCPDYTMMNEKREYWKAMGIPFRQEPEVESGIIFIDKEMCWKALNLTNIMCENSGFYFNFCLGDKDLWRAAWHITETEYYMIPKPISSLNGTMVQHDVMGNKRYYHRNMKKLALAHNERVQGFCNEDKLFAYLVELNNEWKPYAEPITEQDAEDTKALENKRYLYMRLGLDERPMSFGTNQMIAVGKAGMEYYYAVRNGDLHIIAENGTTTAVCQRWAEGWIGRWKDFEKCPILLIETQ